MKQISLVSFPLVVLLSQMPLGAEAATSSTEGAPASEQAAPASEQATPPAAEATSSAVEAASPAAEAAPPPAQAAPAALSNAATPAGATAILNITDLRYRDTQASAYALQKGQFALNSTLFGASSNEFFVALGATYGLGHGVQAGVNLAYLGAGLLNVAGKWTFLEKGPVAVSIDVDPMFVHGDWMWLVGFKELFAGIDMLFLPVQLSTSYLALPWLQFDFATRYTGGVVVADFHASRASLDANINLHEFALRPGVRVHILKRTTLAVTADLPLYTATPAAIEGEVELGPGVAVGGRLGGTEQRLLEDTYRVAVSVRSMVTQTFFIDFGFNVSPRMQSLYGSSLTPRLAVEGRF